MERPNIKDYFAEKADVKTVHNEYINSPHLYSYASNLDSYVDYLEDKLSERENKPEPLESTESKALIIDVVVGQSEQLVCNHSKHTFFRILHKTRKCDNCGEVYEAN
jgi:hypothetical protein